MIPGFSLSFFHSFILFCHGSRRHDGGGGGGTGRRCSSSSCCSRSRCWLAGWLAGPATFFLAPRVSILLHLVCMICKFVLAAQISILLRLVWCIILYHHNWPNGRTRRIRRKRHRYLYCPFCMPSAISYIRSIFFFTYVHSSASSKKSKQVSNQARKKAAGEKTTNTHSVTTFCLHLSLWLYLCDVSGRIWLERQATDCFCKETNIRTETERGAIQEEEEGREEVWR